MNYKNLLTTIQKTHEEIRNYAIKNVNRCLTIRNLLIGHYIVEYEQNGIDRAKYGEKLLKNLAQDLAKKLGKGFSHRYLEKFRKFFIIYLPISKTLFTELTDKKSLLDILIEKETLPPKVKELVQNLEDVNYARFLFSRLSWSHFVELINIKDELKRSFYEIECAKNGWSLREFVKQKNSMLFERVGLSKDKEKVLQLAQKGVVVETANDLLRNPFVFEFLELKEEYDESELKSALIHHLQEFLFEMGKGFCFVARQYRISFNNNHYYIDLILYNRILKCLVLIDLKIREFKPEDAGQMNFYLNYCKEHEMLQGESEPIAIILCASKDDLMVEYAFGNTENKIYTAEYSVVLPSPEELKREMLNYKNRLTNILCKQEQELEDAQQDYALDVYAEILKPFTGILKNRCSRLLDYFCSHDSIRMPEYTKLNQVSERSAHRDFAQFQSKNIIQFVGAKKNGYYELVQNYKELFQKISAKM